MWRSVLTLGGWTVASRVLGFARDILIAAMLGAGPAADAFFVALKLPNLFRRLFGEGAFNAAFVPALAGELARSEAGGGRTLSGEVASVLAAVLGAMTIAGLVAMPWLMRGLAPGFVATPARFALAVTLTRITFPYLALVCLSALLGAVLNTMGRFALAAAMPVLFNVVCIASLLGLAQVLPSAGHALAVGVLGAGVVQLGWLGVACYRAGWLPRLRWPRLTPGVRGVLVRMAPGLVGAGVTQLNLVVGMMMASLLPPGTISVLYYADRVNQLPLGVIGAAMGTALLPALARDVRGADPGAAVARLNRAVELAMALALPAACALGVAAGPIMAVLFGRGAFGPALVARAALALVVYAMGLPAFVLARLLAPAFFARGDTTVPVVIGVVSVACNAALGVLLMRPCHFLAPAIATSAAAMLNAGALAAVLRRRGQLRADAALRARLARMAAAALLMALVVAGLGRELTAVFAVPGLHRWMGLAGLVGAGLGVYGAAGQMLGGFDMRRWQRLAGEA